MIRRSAARWFAAPVLAQLTMLATAAGLVVSGYALLDAIWIRPYLFENPAEIFGVTGFDPSRTRTHTETPRAVVDAWRRRPDREMLSYSLDSGRIGWRAGARNGVVIRVSARPLTFLGLSPVTGRDLSSGPEAQGEVLLAHWFWVQTFGADPAIVGTPISVGADTYQVAGVAPPEAVLPRMPPQAALFVTERPAATSAVDGMQPAGRVLIRSRRTNFQLEEELRAELVPLAASIEKEFPKGLRTTVVPLASLAPASSGAAPMFVTMGVSVLLLVLVNSYQLHLIRWRKRRSEWEIRLVLGANVSSILWRLLLEASAIAVAAWLLGVVAAQAIIAAFGSDFAVGLGLARIPALDALVLRQTTGIPLAIVACLALASGQAVRGLSLRPQAPEYGLTGRRAVRLRQATVALQMMLCAVLITVASIASALFLRLANTDIGMKIDGVSVAAVGLSKPGTALPAPSESFRTFASLEEDLRTIPGLQSVALVDLLPFLIIPSREPVRIVRPSGAAPEIKVSIRRISEGYFETLAIPVRQGRTFVSTDMVPYPTHVVVSEQFATRYLGGGEPVGRFIALGDGPLAEVVGVVGDVRDFQLDHAPEPTVYVPHSDASARNHIVRGILVRSAPDAAQAVASAVALRLNKLRAVGYVFPVEPLSSRTSNSLRAPRLYFLLSGTFAWVALLLGLVGTFVLVNQAAHLERRSTGIRLACGASPWNVMARFGVLYILPVVLGGVAGIGFGLLVSRGMVGLSYADASIGVAPIVAAGTVLMACGVLAVALPVRASLQSNPVRLLWQ